MSNKKASSAAEHMFDLTDDMKHEDFVEFLAHLWVQSNVPLRAELKAWRKKNMPKNSDA